MLLHDSAFAVLFDPCGIELQRGRTQAKDDAEIARWAGRRHRGRGLNFCVLPFIPPSMPLQTRLRSGFERHPMLGTCLVEGVVWDSAVNLSR